MSRGPRVYVAGRTADVERVRLVQGMVRAAGGSITFDWTGAEGEIRKSWADARERARALAAREREAVVAADVTILLCTSALGGLGCFIETGMAMAHGRWVWVVSPARDSVFFHLPDVVVLDDESALPFLLRSWNEEAA